MQRIYVDFNTMMTDERERVLITTIARADLASTPRPGLVTLLYDETLEVEAVVEFDEDDHLWWSEPRWSTIRDLPCPESSPVDRPSTTLERN